MLTNVLVFIHQEAAMEQTELEPVTLLSAIKHLVNMLLTCPLHVKNTLFTCQKSHVLDPVWGDHA